MDIVTVKLINDGDAYLVNGSLTVPRDANNRHHQSIQQWIIDGNMPESEYTLQEYKDKKKEEINQWRATALATMTVDLDGVTYDADETAQANVSRTVTAINSGIAVPDPIDWRDANNVTQQLSHLKIVELAGLMFASVEAAYATSWSRKAVVDAAVDEAAIDAVVW